MRKPLRNPNGYGSVYKLPGRRRRPWIAIVTAGWTENGKQIRQPIGYFETKKEGMDALALHRISPVSPKKELTLEQLYTEWSVVKYKNISKSTENNYRAAWKFIRPLGRAKFKEIRTTHWQAVIDHCKEQDLSQSTIQKVRTLAVQLSDHGLKNDIINKNYAGFIEMPKFERAKKNRFTDLEVLQIEKNAGTVPWADTILILINTGLRITELLSLTRFNINMEEQLITGGIKTEAGKDRIIPIHPKIAKYVQAWLDRNGDALISDDQGKRLPAKRYREKFYYPALEAIGVRRLTPHACRHTFCSRLADAGADPIHIKNLAGHSQYAFTADEYTHPEIDALRKAIEKI